MKIELTYWRTPTTGVHVRMNTDDETDNASGATQAQLKESLAVVNTLKANLEALIQTDPKEKFNNTPGSVIQTVPEILEAGAATYRERNKVYGDNYKHFGQAILSAFGGAIPRIETAEEANRLGVVVQCIGKMTRYCQSFKDGGHLDSAHDAVVYSAMLQELTQ